MKLLLANQATASKRRVYFLCVDATDGITAEVGEAGGQPQISTDGGGWVDAGIGTLSSMGSGYYYAELTQAAVANTGNVISTRYKSANTAESPGTTVQVVAFDPDNVDSLGLARIDNTISSVSGTVTAWTGGLLSLDAGGNPIQGGSVVATTGTTTELDATIEATNDLYNGCILVLSQNTGVGQSRVITDYDGATRTATHAAWAINPDATTAFSIVSNYIDNSTINSINTKIGTPVATVSTDIAAIKAETADIATINTNTILIKDYTEGRWKVFTSGPDANRIVFYKLDGVTVVKKYDLLDSAGNPSSTNPFERDPV